MRLMILAAATVAKLAFAQPYATPAYVQSDAGFCPDGTSCSRGFNRPVTSGNVLIADFITHSSVIAVQDTLRNRWQMINVVTRYSGGDISAIWYTPVPIDGGVDAVTATLEIDAGGPEIHLYEYSGLAPEALDCVSSLEENSAQAGSGQCAVTAPVALLFASSDPFATPLGPGPGFTLREMPSDNPDEDRVVTSPGDYQATFVMADGGDALTLIAAFRAASLAPPADGGPPLSSHDCVGCGCQTAAPPLLLLGVAALLLRLRRAAA